MPGIVGIFGKNQGSGNGAALQSMVDCMCYETFYTAGTYTNEQLSLWIGWVCHRDSFSDCLPIWNATRDICLIFVGEHYGDTGITMRGTGGQALAAHSGARATCLLALYEKHGLGFLEALNGPFNGVLIDLRQRTAVLFNDRYGLLRLYYHEDRTAVYFASEAKAILKILPAVRRVDEQGLAEFLTLGCVLQQRTIFTGIKLLPGASAWQFGPSSEIRRETYFDRSTWENQAPLEGADYFEQLVATWKQILPSYFAGGQDVAISMTGGLDSRMILAWTPRGAGTVPCYTFGGPRRDSADVRLARKVASICGQPHTVITVGRDFLRRFPHFAEKSVFVSDAAMDASGAVDVYIQQLSRQLAPVRLSGVNGGEILRSLVAFKPRQFSDELLCPEIARLSKTAATTYRHELEGHRLSFIAFRQTPWFMTAKFAIEHSQVVFRTPYFDNRLVQLAYRAPAELHGSTAPALQLIAKGNRALADIRTDRGLGAGAVPGGVMAARLFQEFTFKAEYAYDYGMPQWLATLDHRLSVMRLERFFLGRHKFHHFRTYYRDELAGFVKEVLLDPRSLGRSYVNPRSMRKAVAAHTEGRRNYTVELHRLLACELMHRLFIEST